MAESGWEKVEEGRDTGGVQEEELRHIFNIIDKDNSGYLNKSVKHAINNMTQNKRLYPFQEARKARKLIKDRFGIQEVIGDCGGLKRDAGN